MKTFGIGFAIGATLSPAVANAFSTVDQKIKATAGQMGQLQKRSVAVQNAMDLQAKSRELQKIYSASGGTDAVAGEALQKTINQYRVAKITAQKYGVSVGDYAREHAKASKELARTENRLASLTRAKAAADKRQELKGRMVDAIVPAMALATPFRAAINFESAMSDAAKTIDGMRDSSGNLTAQYYDMESAVKQMGRTLPLTHEEIAKLFAAGGQQGMTGVAELQEFATMAAHMSVAFGMSTDEAADAIGGYRTALKLTMPQTREMLDLMNQYANTGSASEKGIADIVRRIGPLGNVAGIAHKPMTALAATLDSMKVAPEVAATGIKNLMLAMTSGTAATKGQQAAFAKLRIDPVALAKQMQKDGPAAILAVLESIKKLPKHAQISLMQEIFGKESLGAIAPFLDNIELVKENLVIAAGTSAYAGAMQKEFENRSKTTANALILAKNAVSELGINLGSVMLPTLVTVLQVVGGGVSLLADFAQKHETLTSLVMGAMTAFTVFKVGALAAAYGATFFGTSSIALGGTLVKLPSLMRLVGMGAHAMLGPFGLVTAAVALIAGYVVQNWESIGPVVMNLWDDLKSAASDFGTCIDEVMIQPIKDLLGWVSKIPVIGDVFSGIGRMLGFGGEGQADFVGPVMPKGYIPSADTIAPKTVEQQKAAQATGQQTAAGTSGPASSAQSAPSPTRTPQASRQASSPASPGVSVTQHFTLNGIADADFAKRVISALEAKKSDFENIVSSIVNDAVRLNYGS